MPSIVYPHRFPCKFCKCNEICIHGRMMKMCDSCGHTKSSWWTKLLSKCRSD